VANILPDEQTKRRLRRGFKRRQRDAKDLTEAADQQIEKLLIRRFDRLVSVRRFIFLWVVLFVLLFFAGLVQIRSLSKYYQSFQPVPGGLYSEGVVGTLNNANPLYATSTPDVAVSRLVFSGLLKYDVENKLIGDLASSWQVSPNGRRYTVSLKQGIKWHDGKPFSAGDVVFTYHTIQDVEAQSHLFTSWQGITVTKQDDYTVLFDLPSQLAAFPHALTNGIVPQHLLADTPPAQLRSSSFNTNPVGTGPFEWKFVEVSGITPSERQQLISLSSYNRYHHGAPKLDGFSIVTFSDDEHMREAFADKHINAMSGLQSVPDELGDNNEVEVSVTPLTAAVMTFFNNSRPILSDLNVRRALISGVDRSTLVSLSNYPNNLVNSPLLRGQLGYDPNIVQLPYNQQYADQLLDQAGWTKNADGYRAKGGQPLLISLSSADTQNYTLTAQYLQREWSKLGVKTEVRYYSADDLQGQVIANHDYDSLLYGVSIGADPDVFAYWHSTQASAISQGRLNLSEYKSSAADQALEAGRTRQEPELRALKYQPFLQAWQNDAPAMALYQPNFIYISHSPVFNYQRKAANTNADRFYNVSNWMVRQQRQNLN